MAKLKIDRIEIAAPKEDRKRLVSYIQRRGVMEVTPVPDYPSLAAEDYSASNDSLAKKRQTCLDAAAVLRAYSSENSEGMFSSLFSAGAPEISEDDYAEITANRNDTLSCAQRTLELSKTIADNNIQLARIDSSVASLEPWLDCPLKLDYKGTAETRVFIGSFPRELSREELLTDLARTLPDIDAVDAEIYCSEGGITTLSVICLKTDANTVEQELRRMGFTYPSDPPAHRAKTQIDRLNAEAESLRAENEDAENELKDISSSLAAINRLADYYSVTGDRNTALEKARSSDTAFFTSGYVPDVTAEKLKTAIENKFDAAVTITAPGEDEDVPVALRNNSFSRPLEGITEMYSLPGKTDIDPTVIMTFFYYFFFGMMLSDAGYGLLIAIATGIYLLKAPKTNPMREKAKMFFFCGISTVFWGAMYGSWFGDLPVVFATNFFGKEKFSMALWMDPLENLMKVLVVCFIFGLIHLFTGVFANSFNLWRQGKKFDSLCECIPTFVAVMGLAPIFFGLFTTVPEWMKKIGTPMLIAGVVLVIATAGRASKSIGGKLGGGLYAVYNLVSGWLGDVLSYARLLALGLSTGVVAQVINMLGSLPSNKALKLVMLIVVSLVGHIANLFINIIGAYVHTNRLQYVEFFGKFYEGGGRALEPLTVNAKSFRFTDED